MTSIAKRRGKKRAIIAIARMILTAIYFMLSTGEIWNPVDLFKVDMPEHLKEQQLQKAVKHAVPDSVWQNNLCKRRSTEKPNRIKKFVNPLNYQNFQWNSRMHSIKYECGYLIGEH